MVCFKVVDGCEHEARRQSERAYFWEFRSQKTPSR